MRAWTLLVLVSLCAGCRREEKRPVRTEPWLASNSSAQVQQSASRASYTVSRGTVTVELRVDGQTERATISRVEGTFEVNFGNPAQTRGRLSADLSSLDFESEALDGPARERLGLKSQSPESERYAELVLTAVNPGSGERRGSAAAQAELTLHRFRVPVLLDLEVDLGAKTDAPGTISVRTRRPFVVSLPAHDLVPEAAGVRRTPSGPPRPTVGKEARISAEIVAVPAPPNDSP